MFDVLQNAILKILELKMEKPRIIVVDDEESMGKFMQIMLSKEGYEVTAVQSGSEALQELKNKRFDLVIADLMMPKMDGIKLLSEVRNIDPDLSFIVMTAFASVDTAIDAMKKGAFDYITKPFKVDEIKLTIKKSLDQKRLTQENIQLKSQLKKELGFENFIGKAPEIVKMKELALKIAASESTVLIQGESGTGKELVAKAIHIHSPRSGKPFISINCAALPESLLESELFGHIKGSFTGAIKDKEGLFKAADGGTFFLDEVGETSPAIQVKLLRVLEEKEITPVGGIKKIPVDVRLVAATNSNLEKEVKNGKFRADLFYRFNVILIDLPPLRNRQEDIPLLSHYFIQKYCQQLNLKEKKIAAPIVSETSALTPPLEEIEKSYIFWVLNQTGWNKSKAASILGIDNSTLYRKIERYSFNEKMRKKQKDYIWGILSFIFIGSLVVYWMTSARSVFWWDSGELIASISTLGIAHRPGFPIYILLDKMFSFLPLGTLTFKV